MDLNSKRSSTWYAGPALLASAAALTLSMAFCGAVHAGPVATSKVNSVQVFSGQAAERVAGDIKKYYREGAPAAVGNAIAARLTAYSGLWPVQIAVLAPGGQDSSGSFDSESGVLAGKACLVVLAVDKKGWGTFARGLPTTMGSEPSAELVRWALDFEALHEIGHCAERSADAKFNHPALTDSQNKALARAMKDSTLGQMWSEAYADSYAMLHVLKAAGGDASRFESTRSHGALVQAWRKMSRHEAQEESLGQLQPDAVDHVTETALEALAQDPQYWVNAPGTLESKAARLASIGVVRAAVATGLSHDLEVSAFDIEHRTLRHYETMVNTTISVAYSLGPNAFNSSADTKDFTKELTRDMTKEYLANGESGRAALTQLSPIIEAAVLGSQKAWAIIRTGQADPSSFEGLSRKIAFAEMDSRNLERRAIDTLNPATREASTYATSLWQKTLAAEANPSARFTDPRSEALGVANDLASKGLLKVDGNFFKGVVPQLNLSDWRKGRPENAAPLILDPAQPRGL